MGEKRGRVRGFFNWIVLLAAAALIAGLVLAWRHCGRGGGGKGLGGGGGIGTGGGTSTGLGPGEQAGAGSKSGEATGAGTGGPAHCQLRLDEGGLTLDGKPVSEEKAVEACVKLGGADLRIVGTTPYGKYESLEKALEARGVKIDVRE